MARPPGEAFEFLRLDPLDAGQLERLHGLMQRSYTAEAARIGVADFAPLARTKAELASNGGEFWGLTRQTRLVAAAELELEAGQELRISSFVVDPPHFRQGLGTRLLREVLSRFPGRATRVSTARANAPALELYAKAGFRTETDWMTGDGIPMRTLLKPSSAGSGALALLLAVSLLATPIQAIAQAWSLVSLPKTPRLNAVHGDASLGRVWAVGEAGTILISTDAGRTWSRSESGTTRELFDVQGDGGRLIAVGAGGTLLVSLDAGKAWKPASSGTEADLRGVAAQADGNILAVGGAGTVLWSTDGLAWVREESGVKADLLCISKDLAFGVQGTILRAYANTDGTSERVVSHRWEQEYSPTDANLIQAWGTPEGRNSYIVSDRGELFSSPYGSGWRTILNQPGLPFGAVAGHSSGDYLLALGANGMGMTSSDWGKGWAPSEPVGGPIRDVWMAPSGATIAVGDGIWRRGPTELERFFDNCDGTLTDRRLGLVWAAADSGRELTVIGGHDYVERLRAGGHKDWRLPTKEQLLSLYDGARWQELRRAGKSDAPVVDPILRLSGAYFLAADQPDEPELGLNGKPRVFTVNLNDGSIVTHSSDTDAKFFVLPVRTP